METAIEKYSDLILKIAVHNCTTYSDAEDVVQDVYIKLLKCKDTQTFNSDEHLKAWLIRVAINRSHDLSKRVSNTNIPLEDNISADFSFGNELFEAVLKLSDNYKNAIFLHYYEGYTAAEIADIMSSTQNTVLSWLSRAKKQLSKILKEDIGDGLE